jgi:hypothetical protein
LKPLPDLSGAGAAPGLEAPPETKGRNTYTFFRSGGDAVLSLSFTRKDAVGRLGALAVLLAIPAVWFWRRRTTRQG